MRRLGIGLIACLLGSLQAAIASDRTLTCFVPLSGETIGGLPEVSPVDANGALIGTDRGLFYFDAASGHVESLVPELKAEMVEIDPPKPGNMMPEITGNEPVGPASTGRVITMLPYTGGAYLIGAENGVFLWHRGVPLRRLVAAETVGQIDRLDLLANDAVLVMTERVMTEHATERGWFSLDKKFAAGPEGTADIGEWQSSYALADGTALILGSTGWIHFNPVDGKLAPAGPVQFNEIKATFALSDGGLLVGGEKGAVQFKASTGTFEPVQGADSESITNIDRLDDGSVIVESDHGLSRFDAASNVMRRIGPTLSDDATTWVLPRGDALIHDAGGWSLLNLTSGQSTKADEPETGRFHRAVAMDNGSRLIEADKGWFTLAPSSSMLRAAGTFDAGSLGPFALRLVHGTDGSELFLTRAGFFRFDPRTSSVVSAGDPDIGYVDHDRFTRIFPLPRGKFLIYTQAGWFRFDPVAKTAVPAGLPPGARISRVWNMGDTAILRWTGTIQHAGVRLLMLPSPTTAAAVVSPITKLSSLTLQPEVSQDVELDFNGLCAPATPDMNLTLGVAINGIAQPPIPVRIKDGTQPSLDRVRLIASLIVDKVGSWNLQLRQGDTDIGKPMAFHERGAIDWKMVSYAVTGFLATVFGILLFLTHYYAWAFRLISDSVWAKFATWPFFFLRHVAVVQLWMLEPWFRAVRAATPTSVAFIDPPITSRDGQRLGGAELLSQLTPKSRLWLQGRSGMGKSAVFGAWVRAYFSSPDAVTLRATKRRFGCVVIPLTIRNYALVNPPDSTRPESWVIEIVRRQLEQFGFATRDRDLIEAMLNSGQFALLLDGANEADCDLALSAFARQFARVRLLVTSQATADDGWVLWQLPQNVHELRESLLCLWLGADAGRALAARIVAQSLSATLLSGYDLRLVADLAAADPNLQTLPRDRVELYRTMLARATAVDGETFDSSSLKFLAWTMLIGRRRDLRAADEETLGPRALTRLTASGILRQIGTAYEFRHDQMRAFLAALWLVEEVPSIDAIEQMISTSGLLSLSRREQDELWAFFVQTLLNDGDIQRLWRFANETPVDRVHLISALKEEARRRSVTLTFTV